jgi:hypothetical protein
MSKKAQNSIGAAGLAIIVVIFIIAVYLYYAGYLNFPSQQQNNNHSAEIPVSINASSGTSLSSLYPNQKFNVISTVYNHGPRSMNVSILGYGCTSTQSKSYITVYPNSSGSTSWSFSAPGSGSCNVQFTSCFSDSSYANYPLVLTNRNFTGQTPVNYPAFSVAPVSISIPSFSSVEQAPPSPTNQTVDISTSVISGGYLENSALNWFNIVSTVPAYIQFPSGIVKISGNENITDSSYPNILNVNGNLVLSILFTLNPVAGSLGYSTNTDLNMSTGYTYCIQSNILQASVS